jgi:trimeric autotransporter adhesin
MRKFSLALFLIPAFAFPQVGIGTSSVHSSAKLQIESSNKGFLPPRVELTGTMDVSTIASPATGLLIYNSATAGTSPNNVTPGYYYYVGSAWVRLTVPTDNAANVSGVVAVANGGTGVTSSTGSGSVVLSDFPALNHPMLGHATVTSINGSTIGRGPGHTIGNIVLGESAFSSNSYGVYNTAVGYKSMYSSAYGWNNTAIGCEALMTSSTGSNSTAVGFRALYRSTANNNDAFGHQSLFDNISGQNNVAIGQSSMRENTSGGDNTVVGYYGMAKNGSGTGNVAIGHYAGHTIGSNTDLTSANNSVFIGKSSKANSNGEENQIVIGYNAVGRGSNTIQLGNSSITNVYTSGDIITTGNVTSSNFITSSDVRLKNISGVMPSTDQINTIQYEWKDGRDQLTHIGYAAQEVEKVLPDAVYTDKDGLKAVNYSEVHTYKLQQQEQMIKDLQAELASLKKMMGLRNKKNRSRIHP